MSEFRVLFNPCLGSGNEFKSEPAGSYEAANAELEAIANYTLFLHKNDLMEDYSNYGLIQQKVGDEWIDFD